MHPPLLVCFLSINLCAPNNGPPRSRSHHRSIFLSPTCPCRCTVFLFVLISSGKCSPPKTQSRALSLVTGDGQCFHHNQHQPPYTNAGACAFLWLRRDQSESGGVACSVVGFEAKDAKVPLALWSEKAQTFGHINGATGFSVRLHQSSAAQPNRGCW